MTETVYTITSWANETFGPAKSNLRIATRANEEMAELLKCLAADDNDVSAVEEIADIYIVLARIVAHHKGDLQAVIDAKMAINRRREWNLDGTGCAYHVKG